VCVTVGKLSITFRINSDHSDNRKTLGDQLSVCQGWVPVFPEKVERVSPTPIRFFFVRLCSSVVVVCLSVCLSASLLVYCRSFKSHVVMFVQRSTLYGTFTIQCVCIKAKV
jgi:hypothetical protein